MTFFEYMLDREDELFMETYYNSKTLVTPKFSLDLHGRTESHTGADPENKHVRLYFKIKKMQDGKEAFGFPQLDAHDAVTIYQYLRSNIGRHIIEMNPHTVDLSDVRRELGEILSHQTVRGMDSSELTLLLDKAIQKSVEDLNNPARAAVIRKRLGIKSAGAQASELYAVGGADHDQIVSKTGMGAIAREDPNHHQRLMAITTDPKANREKEKMDAERLKAQRIQRVDMGRTGFNDLMAKKRAPTGEERMRQTTPAWAQTPAPAVQATPTPAQPAAPKKRSWGDFFSGR